MDAQLRLDINRLKSQKEEMRKATEGDQFGVYAYLRENDSANGKAGSPYYIGKMADVYRPWGKHTTRPPSDPKRVRLLRGGLTEQEANEWEKFYIKKYGRIDLGTGILRNLKPGGEGGAHSPLTRAKIGAGNKGKIISAEARAKLRAALTGRKHSEERRAKVSAALTGRAHSAETRAKMSATAKQTPVEIIAQRTETRKRAIAAQYGIDPAKYLTLSQPQRAMVASRYNRGKRGDELLEGLNSDKRNPRLIAAAKKYEMSYEQFEALNKSQKSTVVRRYRRGIRGAALLEGLI